MRVLLIAANTERGNMITMPLGAGLVAAATRAAGHDVEFLDLLTSIDPAVDVSRTIESFSPDAIGISVRNIDNQNREQPRFFLAQVRPVIEACRKSSPAPLILGGPGFSIFPRQTLSYLDADYGIAGEGETSFIELLRRLDAGEDPSGIPGLCMREGFTPPSHDGTLASFPTWDSALTASALATGEEVWLPFQTRRGCPNDCSYCSTAAIQGHTIRARPARRAVKELANLARSGFRRFYFVDNSFNIPEPYALSLCALLEEARLGIEWRCILYPQNVSERLVSALARAGCVEVSLGFESGNAAVLREMNKRYTPDEVRSACKLLREHGVRRMGFLLLGGPGETRQSVEESLAFAESLQLDSLRVTIGIRIYPHTPLARRAVEEGMIRSEDDLLEPKFFLSRSLDPWIYQRVSPGLVNGGVRVGG